MKVIFIALLCFCSMATTQAAIPGSLDESYQPIMDGGVRDIAPLPDGKACVLGSFNTVNDVSRPGIARLNEDGTLDTAFDPGSGPSTNGYLMALLLQKDGDILVTGKFYEF